jgi:hypothetical protein
MMLPAVRVLVREGTPADNRQREATGHNEVPERARSEYRFSVFRMTLRRLKKSARVT